MAGNDARPPKDDNESSNPIYSKQEKVDITRPTKININKNKPAGQV